MSLHISLMRFEEQLVERKRVFSGRVLSPSLLLLMPIALYIIYRIVSIYIWTRRQSNQGKQGRGNDIIRLLP